MQQGKNTQFLLKDRNIRGQIVQLSQAWQDIQSTQHYSDQLAQVLGQSIAAVAALASTVKLDGSMIMQVQGDGPISTLVAQATHNGNLRGLVRTRSKLDENANFSQLVGEARFVITIEAQGAQRYQGIVECEGEVIADSFNAYFTQSEQLATRLWLMADRKQAACFLLQQLPSDNKQTQINADWEHSCILADTLSDEELATLSPTALLHRLFHEEDVEVFPSTDLQFACQCSTAKVQNVIVNMGETDAMALIAEEGEINADCEFCAKTYRFDKIDVASMFSATQSAPTATQ